MNTEYEFDDYKETIINNEYDFSNIVPTIEGIDYLVNYCYKMYNNLLNLCQSDEDRNKQIKYEFQHYDFKKHYTTNFEVYISDGNYKSTTLNSYDTFKEAVNKGLVNNVKKLKITLDMSYKRGDNNQMVEYNNTFIISFEPYLINLTRKANHNEENMQKIENDLISILKRFPTVNTIFCTK